MDIFLVANILITLALILQFLTLQNNKRINPYSFLLISLSTFIMAYAQYKYKDNKYNIGLKIINGIISTIIFIQIIY